MWNGSDRGGLAENDLFLGSFRCCGTDCLPMFGKFCAAEPGDLMQAVCEPAGNEAADYLDSYRKQKTLHFLNLAQPD